MNAAVEKLSVRNRLLETANRLFYEHGYKATGINEVIKEAGIAKASFYHHFKTKEDLLIVTLEQRHDRMMTEVRAVTSAGTTAGEKIARIFEWLGTQCSCGSSSRGCAYLNMVSEFRDASCKVREVVRWHKNTFRKYLQELITAHYRGAAKPEEELESAADELYLLIEAVFAASPVHQCTWPAETAFRIANDRFKLV
ncbi:MAG: TetR/AcrR family transcriptional regulator [Planctomycetes bacterium]|nr:TetR/AcrR family transcriptional regulator [Planctomycetota bacterium]